MFMVLLLSIRNVFYAHKHFQFFVDFKDCKKYHLIKNQHDMITHLKLYKLLTQLKFIIQSHIARTPKISLTISYIRTFGTHPDNWTLTNLTFHIWNYFCISIWKEFNILSFHFIQLLSSYLTFIVIWKRKRRKTHCYCTTTQQKYLLPRALWSCFRFPHIFYLFYFFYLLFLLFSSVVTLSLSE